MPLPDSGPREPLHLRLAVLGLLDEAGHGERDLQHVLQVVVRGVAFLERRVLAAVEGGSRFHTVPVHHGDFYPVGGFTLEFFGDLHQEIHRSFPLIQNCGVMVDDRLYYPGDSYTQPDRAVEILACPASAPWLKIGDVMDFIAAIKPARSFATHNALLSDFGHTLNNGRIKLVTEQGGGEFTYLQVGDALDI